MTLATRIVPLPAALSTEGLGSERGRDSSVPWVLTHHRLIPGPSPVLGAPGTPFPSLLADKLDPGETLTLHYDLRPAAVSDATVTIILRTRGDQYTFAERRNAQRMALSMCLPGYNLEVSAEAA